MKIIPLSDIIETNDSITNSELKEYWDNTAIAVIQFPRSSFSQIGYYIRFTQLGCFPSRFSFPCPGKLLGLFHSTFPTSTRTL